MLGVRLLFVGTLRKYSELQIVWPAEIQQLLLLLLYQSHQRNMYWDSAATQVLAVGRLGRTDVSC